MSKQYFSGWDDKTIMADVDVNGNSLELTIEDEKVKAIGNIPVGGGDESVWTDETYNALSDDNDDEILDENNEPIGGDDSETLWATRDGIGFKAERAEADINGNSLELTIEDNKVVEIGGHTLNGGTIDAYTKTQADEKFATNESLNGKVDILVPSSENNLASLDSSGQLTEMALTVVNNSITAIGGKTITGTESVFVAIYGKTTGNQIYEAINAGKYIVSLRYNGSSYNYGILTYQDNNYKKYGFTEVSKTSNQVSQSAGNISFGSCFCDGSGNSWYAQTENFTLPRPTSGNVGKMMTVTNNSGSYNYGFINVPESLPASTSSDEGKVLAVNASGSPQWTQLPWVAADYQIPPETIKIGDKYYRIVTIGNQQWMAENLDYVWDGLTADSTAIGCYYVEKKTNYSNNDQSRYGEYGRLYDWYAAKNLNDNLSTILGTKLATDGWHVPSQADFEALITYAGGTSTAGTKLKMTSIRGTDDYGFSWQPCGVGQDSGGNLAYYRWGQWGLIWSLYDYDSSKAYAYAVYFDATSCGTSQDPKLLEASIRLVRNLT